ncbi:YolD-like family protein [Staphylococcus lloydii]|uniref:YolD-like family protein n=1 Tax=Staphylococcus lloydii TaxID=2781774 RepID=UPI0029291D3F|nr:YolD-like family protein [Staphylococcus lloydii]MDU9417428.1 YolD-like family protein [Staphylococcus lloydii]
MLDQNKIERLLLSDDQLRTLNEKLIDKMFSTSYIELIYFTDGNINEETGYFHKVDVHNSELQLSVNGEIIRLSLLDIGVIK